MQNLSKFITGWPGIVTTCLFLLAACQTPPSKPVASNAGPANANNTGNYNNAVIPSGSSGAHDTTSLKGIWFLQNIAGAPISDLKTVYISFDTAKSSFTGSTGCNTLKGVFWFSDNDTSIVFGDHLLASKMACQGDEERAFIRSLMNTNHYCLQNGKLTLLVDGRELSGWTRMPPSQRTVKL